MCCTSLKKSLKTLQSYQATENKDLDTKYIQPQFQEHGSIIKIVPLSLITDAIGIKHVQGAMMKMYNERHTNNMKS